MASSQRSGGTADNNKKSSEQEGVGGQPKQNNERGTHQEEAQGPGKINAGTNIPAQGIDNANKEAERELTTGGPLVDSQSGISSVNTPDGLNAGKTSADTHVAGNQTRELGPNEQGTQADQGGKTEGNVFSGGKDATTTSTGQQKNLQDEGAALGSRTREGSAGIVGTATQPEDNKEKTPGAIAMAGVANPTNHGGAGVLKEQGEEFINVLSDLKISMGDNLSPEQQIAFNTAKTKIVEAVMQGVTALSA